MSSELLRKAETFFEIQNFQLRDSSGLHPWTREEIFLELQNSLSCVFELGSPVSAFILFREQNDEIEIMHLAVREKGKGQGSALLRDFFSYLKQTRRLPLKIFLEVSEKNFAARKCYETIGFVLLGSRKNYYRNGDTALNMMYSLPSPNGKKN